MIIKKIIGLLLLAGCGSLTGPSPNLGTGTEAEEPKTGSIRIVVCPFEGCPQEPVDSTRTKGLPEVRADK